MHSAKLVVIADARQARDLTVEEAFDAYVKARAKVDETLSIEDGIAAARLWRRFIELFVRA